jgi:hypothetical protein
LCVPDVFAGWGKQWDDGAQDYYYYNQQTGQTQWEPPTGRVDDELPEEVKRQLEVC